jgi:hypothetical protein
MTLSVGDRIPDVTVMRLTGEGPAPVASADALGSGTVVWSPFRRVHGVFRPAPARLVLRADELRAKGVAVVGG